MEHEVSGHAKKIYSISKNPEHGIWKKISDIFIEVLIIVFAVTLSIWLHGRSEHKHQQEEVNYFLMGLKNDLLKDVNEMTEDMNSFEKGHKAFSYLATLKKGVAANRDSLGAYTPVLNQFTVLITNNGRYEGFKSSGKLTNIENKELQNDIADLYQENIPILLASTTAYNKRKELVMTFFFENKKKNADGTNNVIDLIYSDKAQNLFESLVSVTEIIDRYRAAIDKAKKIISSIENQEKH